MPLIKTTCAHQHDDCHKGAVTCCVLQNVNCLNLSYSMLLFVFFPPYTNILVQQAANWPGRWNFKFWSKCICRFDAAVYMLTHIQSSGTCVQFICKFYSQFGQQKAIFLPIGDFLFHHIAFQFQYCQMFQPFPEWTLGSGGMTCYICLIFIF